MLSTMGKIRYCVNIWILNHKRFTESDIDYYKGLYNNKNPHGIDNFYWKKAYKLYTSGFKPNNKISINNYFLPE